MKRISVNSPLRYLKSNQRLSSKLKTKISLKLKGINDITIEMKESEDKNVSLKEEKQALDAQIKDLLSNSNNSSEQLDKLSEDNAKLTSEMEKIRGEI